MKEIVRLEECKMSIRNFTGLASRYINQWLTVVKGFSQNFNEITTIYTATKTFRENNKNVLCTLESIFPHCVRVGKARNNVVQNTKR